MLKKENYFGMYLNQKCYITEWFRIEPNSQQNYCYYDKGIIELTVYSLKDIFKNNGENSEYAKLILRPFEDMTEEEVFNFTRLIGRWNDGITWVKSNFIKYVINCLKSEVLFYLDEIQYLISIGIDIFNLKQKGFAVYESDLKGEN